MEKEETSVPGKGTEPVACHQKRRRGRPPKYPIGIWYKSRSLADHKDEPLGQQTSPESAILPTSTAKHDLTNPMKQGLNSWPSGSLLSQYVILPSPLNVILASRAASSQNIFQNFVQNQTVQQKSPEKEGHVVQPSKSDAGPRVLNKCLSDPAAATSSLLKPDRVGQDHENLRLRLSMPPLTRLTAPSLSSDKPESPEVNNSCSFKSEEDDQSDYALDLSTKRRRSSNLESDEAAVQQLSCNTPEDLLDRNEVFLPSQSQKYPDTWTSEEVSEFVFRVTGSIEYAKMFRDNDIDGAVCVHLTEDHLVNYLNMKLGPAMKFLVELGKVSRRNTSASF